MLYRMAYLENRKVLGDSGETSIDVNLVDPVSAIWLELRATNGATYNQESPLCECIESVELVDGGNVLWSLDGQEAWALMAYRLGYIPYQLIIESANVTQNWSVPMLFGRFIGDKQYALDPTKYKNLQIRIKWNLAAINAVAATGFVASSGRLTVMAIVMEGAPNPVGMITAKDIKAFTTASSGIEYTDLPTDRLIKSLMIRGYLTGNHFGAVFTNVKLSCNGGGFIPIDMRGYDVTRLMTMIHPEFHYKHCIIAADGDTPEFLLTQDEHLAITPYSEEDLVASFEGGAGTGTINLDQASSALSGDAELWIEVSGFCPWTCVHIPFGDPNDPADWFPAQTFKGARLELTQGVASAEGHVVLEQLLIY